MKTEQYSYKYIQYEFITASQRWLSDFENTIPATMPDDYPLTPLYDLASQIHDDLSRLKAMAEDVFNAQAGLPPGDNR